MVSMAVGVQVKFVDIVRVDRVVVFQPLYIAVVDVVTRDVPGNVLAGV
jgi:hypothetical protein